MLVQPGQSGSVSDRQSDAMHFRSLKQVIRNDAAKAVHALPGQRGDGNDILPPLGVLFKPLAIIGIERVELVPDLQDRRG